MKKAKSLFERKMETPSFQKKFEEHRRLLALEIQFLKLLEKKELTFEAFAELIGTKKGNISRDLRGKGLASTTVRRIRRMANALDADFLPILLPRDARARKQKLKELQKIA